MSKPRRAISVAEPCCGVDAALPVALKSIDDDDVIVAV
jgi:hypothetical protein